MLFKVFGRGWGPGGVEPIEVLQRFVAAEPKTLVPEDPRQATNFEVEITPAELMAMIEAKDFDILVSARGFLAFDGPGRQFRQR